MFWKSWLSKPEPVRRRSTPLRMEQLESREVPAVGGLDITFNGTGTTRFQFSGPTDGETAAATAVQADGKIVVAGTFNFNNGAASNFAVARFNAGGSLDTTFGNGGRVFINTSGTDETVSGLAIQDDGKIVIGGTATIGGDKDFVVARLTTTGAPDTTFGSNGQTTVNFAAGIGNNDICFGVATQIIAGARKIVLVGSAEVTGNTTDFAAARLNENGGLDTTFNGAGKKTHTFGATDVAQAVAIDQSNRLVLAGYTGTGTTNVFAVLRLNTDGTENTSFGTSGERTADFTGTDERATAVAIQSDGKVVVGGSAFIASAADFAVARFTDTTGLDATFDTDGKQTVTFGSEDLATSLVIQSDGKIVVGGSTTVGATGIAVIRLTAVGALDTTFDGDGKFSLDLGGTESINGLALDKKGRIVVAGFSTISTPDFIVGRLIAYPETSTVGVFDSSTGNWYLRNSNSAGATDIGPFAFGAPGWLGFTGDWDGNGTVTPGVYNPATGTFYLRNSNSAGGADFTIAFGPVGNTIVPVVGDWDGDGVTTIGTFDSSNAVWYFRNSNSVGPPDAGNLVYGAPGWKPVVGDWDGNGTTTIGVVDPNSQPGATWYLRNSLTPGAPDIPIFTFGLASWKPVVGDWDGNGISTIGVFDNTSGNWYLRNTNSAGPVDIGPFAFGAGAWTPVSGDWNFPNLP